MIEYALLAQKEVELSMSLLAGEGLLKQVLRLIGQVRYSGSQQQEKEEAWEFALQVEVYWLCYLHLMLKRWWKEFRCEWRLEKGCLRDGAEFLFLPYFRY